MGSFLAYRYLTPLSIKFLINFSAPSPSKESNRADPLKSSQFKKLERQIQQLEKRVTQEQDPQLRANLLRILQIESELRTLQENLYKNLEPFLKKKFGSVESFLSISDYIDWVVLFILVVGLVFQLPLVIGLLASMGIIKIEVLKKGRPIAFVIILVISAVLTPPDILSQLMVGASMYLLYEISILVSSWAEKRSKKRQKKEKALLEDTEKE